MRILKTLGLLIAPIFAVLGIDFTLSKLVQSGKIKLSRDSEKKYKEIESEYKQYLLEWASKKGINLKRPSNRDKEFLRKEMEAVEGEVLDKFIDFLRKNRRHRDLKILAAGAEVAKIINEHLKN